MGIDRLSQRLARGEAAYGFALSWPDPDLVEAAGIYGFDYTFIDTEHDSLDVRACTELVRAAACGGMPSFIRLPYGDVRIATKYLDIGAHGLIFPHVTNAREAEAAVRASMFPPRGLRGGSNSTRAARYGWDFKADEYYRSANDAVWVLPIVEDVQGVQALEEILAVPGINGFFIGPGDLALSRLALDQQAYPSVETMVDEAIGTGVRLGKVVATDAVTPEAAASLIARGVRMLVVGAATLLRSACLGYLESMPRRAPK